MSRSRWVAALLFVVAAGGVLGLLLLPDNREESKTRHEERPDVNAQSRRPAGAQGQVAAHDEAGPTPAAAHRPRLPSGVVAKLPWGSGPNEIGRPVYGEGHEEEAGEGHGRAPLMLSADANGELVLLDATHSRLLRMGSDGQPKGTVPLSGLKPRDLAVAENGTVLVLDSHQRKSVTLLDAEGRPRGELPLAGANVEDPEAIRAVQVAGEDVFVESLSGEYVRVGDVHGKADSDRPAVPGLPLRDGSGYLTARILDAMQGTLHVFVIDKEPASQRFSRQVRTSLQVEGIFFIDSDLTGVIYLGIQGNLPDAPAGTQSLQLLCLESQKGMVLGTTELPVNAPEEVVMDAAALDGGGVVLNVWTPQGIRVDRRHCR